MNEGESLTKAASTWLSTGLRTYGENRDPAYHLALRGVDEPLDAKFERCALTLFGPLLRLSTRPMPSLPHVLRSGEKSISPVCT